MGHDEVMGQCVEGCSRGTPFTSVGNNFISNAVQLMKQAENASHGYCKGKHVEVVDAFEAMLFALKEPPDLRCDCGKACPQHH